MIAELLQGLTGDVAMGMVQALCVIVICLGVVLLCRRFAVHVERETIISLSRGLVQMVAVGVVLAVLLHGNLLIAALILLGMTFAAAATAARRAPEISGALPLSFYAIGAGAGLVIAAMLVTRTVTSDIAVLVPVGSMIIANAMNACAQSMERFRADVRAHIGRIEAALALGAAPAVTVAPFVQSGVYASLLPRLDMLKSLGLVWIPGVMAGMLVSGASPIYAGIFQFIIVAMILAASGVAGLVATLLMRTRAFSEAEQLTLRPSVETATRKPFSIAQLWPFGRSARRDVATRPDARS
jgi:putative ABC transport system permease protein